MKQTAERDFSKEEPTGSRASSITGSSYRLSGARLAFLREPLQASSPPSHSRNMRDDTMCTFLSTGTTAANCIGITQLSIPAKQPRIKGGQGQALQTSRTSSYNFSSKSQSAASKTTVHVMETQLLTHEHRCLKKRHTQDRFL